MTDAWSLYDRMIAQVPEDALVRRVVMGAHHCLVDAECGTGVAALHRGGARLRMERGLSQEELASHLHVVRQTISKWEKGVSPTKGY